MSSNASNMVQVQPPGAHSDQKEGLDRTSTELKQLPEGGGAAWRTVIGCALVQFCGFGYATSFGVYQDFYTRQYLQNESPSTISWIGSVEAFITMSSSLISGPLYDRGYFYHLLVGGTLLHSFSLFMLSLTRPDQYYQIFLVQGIGLGIAHGLLYVPTLAVMSQYFHKRRTISMSLVAAGASVGAIVHPIMLNNLLNSLGFVDGVRISAAFVSVLLFVSCLLIRTRLEPPKDLANYLSIGKNILRDVPFCIMCIGLLCFITAFYYPLFYLQLDSVLHRNSKTFSFYSLVFLNGGSLMGRLTAGLIAPLVGVPVLITISIAVCSILILSMIGLSTVPTVVAIGMVYGYFSGHSIALMSPLVAHLTCDTSELGARMGITMAVLSIGCLVDGPISGALLTPQFKWWQPALFNGLICLTGAALLVLMQLILTRRKRSSDEQSP